MPRAPVPCSTTTRRPRSNRRAGRSCSRPDCPTPTLPTRVAPGSPDLGVFLAVHARCTTCSLAGVGRPLVMTSGNSSDEPIAHDDDDAAARLGPMVDGLLTHDREIHIRCDDSVARADRAPAAARCGARAATHPSRCACRSLRPRAVLAVGAELKSDDRGRRAARCRRQSPHRRPRAPRDVPVVPAGGRPPSRALRRASPRSWRTTCTPSTCRPSSRSTWTCPVVAVQHHHAHVAACMVEHGRTEPVLGLAFDGLGYGTDGTLWGGELLVAGLRRLRRGSATCGRCRCRAARRRSASRGAWRRCGRTRPASTSRRAVDGVDAATVRRGARPRRRRPRADDDEHGPAVRRGGRAARWPARV